MKKPSYPKKYSAKKPYNPPVLTKAGTLQELTRGFGLSGIDSLSQPKSGGTE